MPLQNILLIYLKYKLPVRLSIFLYLNLLSCKSPKLYIQFNSQGIFCSIHCCNDLGSITEQKRQSCRALYSLHFPRGKQTMKTQIHKWMNCRYMICYMDMMAGEKGKEWSRLGVRDAGRVAREGCCLTRDQPPRETEVSAGWEQIEGVSQPDLGKHFRQWEQPDDNREAERCLAKRWERSEGRAERAMLGGTRLRGPGPHWQ